MTHTTERDMGQVNIKVIEYSSLTYSNSKNMSNLKETITKIHKYGKAGVSEHLKSKPRDRSLISKVNKTRNIN